MTGAMGARVGTCFRGGLSVYAAHLPLDLHPELGEWRDRLEQLTGRPARLAGSGSTWIVDGSFPGPDVIVARTVPAHGARV